MRGNNGRMNAMLENLAEGLGRLDFLQDEDMEEAL